MLEIKESGESMDDVPNGFKITEVGSLPEEWQVARLADVAEFSKKPRGLRMDRDTQIPFIPMESISEDTPSVKGWKLKRLSEVTSGSFVFKGDLILAKITPSFENGKQAILDNLPGDFAYATTEVWAFHPNQHNQVLTSHLYNYLKMPSVRSGLAGKMEGSTHRQRFPKHVVANLKIPLPPLPEQKRIAAVLSAIQEAKEKTEAIIQAAKALKQSLMKHLFTYGPVPVDEAEKVPLKETEIGEVPKDWQVAKVSDLYEFSRKPRNLTISEHANIPFIPMELIQDDNTSVKGWELKKCSEISSGSFVFKGDLIIAKITPSFENGKQAILDDIPSEFAYATTEVWTLHPRNEQVSTSHLYNYLRIPFVRASIAGKMEGSTGRQRVPKHVIQNLPVPIPPIAEQDIISRAIQTLDDKIAVEKNRKYAFEELFKTLLHDLMTAKIRANQLEVPA